MKQRINRKLGLISLIAIVATALGVTFFCYGLFQSRVKTDLRLFASLLKEAEIFRAEELNDSISDHELKALDPDELRITWVDQGGTVLFDNETDASALPNHRNRPEIAEAFAKGSGEITRRSDTFNLNTYYYAVLLEDGTVLRVSTQARNITSVFLSALPVIAIIALIILLCCILISHMLTTQLLRPIEEMVENIDGSNPRAAYKELEPFADKIRLQRENILASVKSRQDFTANVSHELKTPITSISGYAELIENRMVEGDSAIHIAKQIRHNANRLLSLVNDIIKLSELDHTELKRVFEPVDLYKVAGESIKDLEGTAISRNIILSLSGRPCTISGDPSQIREMVDNLLQNAIRYNKEGGKVEVTADTHKGHPHLVVKDNGIGIPKEHQDRIFERFYRVDKSRSRETGGTGLGLAIVKHIAEIHSGTIELKSAPGEGTEITISF